MPLGTAIETLQAHPSVFPRVDFVYNEQDPARQDLILALPAFQLRFDPEAQRLKVCCPHSGTRAHHRHTHH